MNSETDKAGITINHPHILSSDILIVDDEIANLKLLEKILSTSPLRMLSIHFLFSSCNGYFNVKQTSRACQTLR